MVIESEKNRQELVDIITRWSKSCKVDHLLRDYDIPGLAESIMEVFYHVKLSCGHWVRDTYEGVHLAWDDIDGTVYGTYCLDCARKYKKELKACEVKDD